MQNLRRRSRLRWIGAVALVLGVFLINALVGLVATVIALAAALLFFVQALNSTTSRRSDATLLLTDDALRVLGPHVEPELVFPLRSIASGFTSERKAVLTTHEGVQVELTLADDDPARVLDHAGVGLAQRTLTLPLRGTLGAFTIGFMAFWPLLVASIRVTVAVLRDDLPALLLGLLVAAIATALVVMRFGLPRVVVGVDGVRVLRVRDRFVGYDQIASVGFQPSTYENPAQTVHLVLRDGSVLPLPTIAAPRERVLGLAERIRYAAQSHRDGGARRLDGLSRAGRELTAWKAEIERMAVLPPGFRDHALGADDFDRVLADAAAPPDQRIGAALALRAIDPAAAAPRIRIAADTSADDALRDALGAAAEGELDDVLLERATARKATR